MFELMKCTDNSEKIGHFLQEHGCLSSERLCPQCNSRMVQTERADRLQTHIFRCSKRHGTDKPRCLVVESITKGSFFFNAHVSLFTLVWILWGFCEGMGNSWFVRHLGLSSRTVTDWLNFCREVCMVCIEGESRQIGGFGCIVEIDESKFVKRKYHRGKARRCEDWVVGGICREKGKVFMRVVKNRSRETLQEIIAQYVAPGSIIFTDCWAAYKDLENMPDKDYLHFTVNHSKEFVNNETGCHTNTIEGTWAHCKRATPKLGLQRDFLDGYLCRFIWFKLTKSVGKDPFLYLLECISKQYKLPGSRLATLVDEFYNKDTVEV